MAIQKLFFNWFSSPENGDEYQQAVVGEEYAKSIVKNIDEHRSQGEGDRWFYDINLESGEMVRVFNPNTVLFDKDETPF